MQIPAFLYGQFKDVKRSCQKIVRRFAQGESWETVFADCQLLETERHPGFIVIDGPDAMLNSIGPHFHVFCLMRELDTACYPEDCPARFQPPAYRKYRMTKDVQPIFDAALQTEWGFLMLLCRQNYLFWHHHRASYSLPELETKRYRPFLTACSQYWCILDGEGARYTEGSLSARGLWDVTSSITFIMARMGVPGDVLRLPLSTRDIQPLIDLALQGQLSKD